MHAKMVVFDVLCVAMCFDAGRGEKASRGSSGLSRWHVQFTCMHVVMQMEICVTYFMSHSTTGAVVALHFSIAAALGIFSFSLLSHALDLRRLLTPPQCIPVIATPETKHYPKRLPRRKYESTYRCRQCLRGFAFPSGAINRRASRRGLG